MSNMQQYGAAKNPPWARNAASQGIPGMQQQMMAQNVMPSMGQANMMQYPQSPSVFQPNLMTQQANMAMGMPQIQQGMGMGSMANQMGQTQMFPQTSVVSYPAPRALNPNSFSNNQSPNQGQSNLKQRVFTGTVTKAINNDFGFVDEDVFFQKSVCVKGSIPMVGDRVLVEATYKSDMPFRWNATRIQVLPTNKNKSPAVTVRDHGNKNCSSKNTYNAVPPPANNPNKNYRSSRSRSRDKKTLPLRDSKSRRKVDEGRKGAEESERSRKTVREREKDRDSHDKEKEKHRSPSVKSSSTRKRPRTVARYLVRVPKIALNIPEADVLEVRRRYNNLYVPSDFFNTKFRWVDAFPPESPFSLNKPCLFRVMPKDIDNPMPNDAVLEPSDANYSFCAKVMLLSMPSLDEVYKKCCGLASEKKSRDSEDRDFIHPTRLLSFLVGFRGKNETMAIGGPWSPSLDGPNPESNPEVLIKTAIRTCKALTGINLSNCTQWYRFVELYYHRAESTHRGLVMPARVETVVIFVPDVWSCLPTRLEWDSIVNSYLQKPPEPTPAQQQDQGDKSINENVKKEPTPYMELDPKTMNVTSLRKELWARNINNKGLKSQLVARLTKVLKREETIETSDDVPIFIDDDTDGDNADVILIEDESTDDFKQEDEEKSKHSDKDKGYHKSKNELPENPHLLVHPSRTAKSGKFDCTVMTLSVLLDYRQEDSKEHSFEVSLFAELFNEMLMRDFGFNIYKALYVLPDKPKDGKKDESDSKKQDLRDDKKDDYKRSDNKGKKNGDKKDEVVLIDDENSGDKRSVGGDTKSDRRDRPKLITKDPLLLLSFVYFDITHYGYIMEKDMEELIYSLGLNLSRAQVKKLISRTLVHSLQYRQLTDKPKDEEKNEEPSDVDLTDIVAGNKKLLPVFKTESEMDCDEPVSKKVRTEAITSENMISYKGGLLDIAKLLDQLKRSEQCRSDTESRLMELKNDNNRLSEKHLKSSQVVSNLTSELSEVKRKLHEANSQLSKSAICTKIFHTALKDIDLKIQSVIHTNLYEDSETHKQKSESTSRWNSDSTTKKESVKEIIKSSTEVNKPSTNSNKTNESDGVLRNARKSTENSDKAKVINDNQVAETMDISGEGDADCTAVEDVID